MSSDDDRYRIALSAVLPGDQANGWEDMAEELDGDRAKIRYARIAYTVQKVSEVTATGKRIVAMQLVRIEPVNDADNARDDEQMLMHLFEERTGQATLFPPRGDDA